jgi:hypothetical protein
MRQRDDPVEAESSPERKTLIAAALAAEAPATLDRKG